MTKRKKAKLCYGEGVPVNPVNKLIINNPIKGIERLHYDDAWDGMRQTGIKRIILKCTTCGRRLKASASICHDACCIIFSMPPHKPRMWWKRNRRPKK